MFYGNVFYGLTIAVHLIACVLLITAILLQAGKGGGLNEAFSSVTQSMFGSKSNVYLVRATAFCAIMFLCTSVLLSILTSKRERSLIGSQLSFPTANAALPGTQPLGQFAGKAEVEPENATPEQQAAPIAPEPPQK